MRYATLTLVLLVAVVTAQDLPKPTFRAEANYVRVDIFATADGRPVTDLKAEDFEILDQGQPQKVDQFEHISIRPAGPQDTRIEPNTVEQSRQLLATARARVFVLFLDTTHVGIGGSHNIRKPLVDALDRIIGPEDLVGVMTPEMSARDITFARKTTTIDGFLERHWNWGERDRLNPVDPTDSQYMACYPGNGPTATCADDDRGVAAAMIARRHEKHTLDALHDLVGFLRGVREERKAVITISDGWLLYRPDPGLSRRLYCQVPGGQEVGVDPRTGKLSTKDTRNPYASSRYDCDRDRMQLANIDDDDTFRRILDEANRANTAFYPIDPRGLAVFDTPITSNTPLDVDAAMLRNRTTSLRTLAEATDGLAIVGSNDLAKGLSRVVSDLTDYYLVGYYSTQKLDGRFHPLTVRVKRPGVQVRARRGYLAADEREVTAARERAAASPEVSPAAEAEARALSAATGPLEGYTRELPLRLAAASGYAATGAAQVFVVGELGATEARGDDWKTGGSVDVQLAARGGATVASAKATLEPGTKAFRVTLTPPAGTEPGDYDVRARARGNAASMANNASLAISLAPAPGMSGVIFVRRGPTTGNREVATADLRFRRSESVRVELLAVDAAPPAARLLDRTGKPLAVPVTVARRADAAGIEWDTAQVALAPLAAGDYVIELTGSSTPRVLAGFRLVQ